MIRYALYDPVSKYYDSMCWKSPADALDYANRLAEINNPKKWEEDSKYYRKYKKAYDYYKRLVLKRAKIKWEPA
jgi:hypothetical protein